MKVYTLNSANGRKLAFTFFFLFCVFFVIFLKLRYDWHLISYILEFSYEFITTSRILPQEHKEEF